jgi:hypothetical protein
MNYIDAAL